MVLRLETMIIATLCFCFCVVGFVVFYNDIAVNAGISLAADTTSAEFNQLNAINNNAEQLLNATQAVDTKTDPVSTAAQLGSTAFQVMLSSLSTMKNLVIATAAIFHLPAFVVTFLIAVIVISMIFAGIYLLTGITGGST